MCRRSTSERGGVRGQRTWIPFLLAALGVALWQMAWAAPEPPDKHQAQYLLPWLDTDESLQLHVRQVSLEVRVVTGSTIVGSEFAVWRPDRGWTDVEGNPSSFVSFDLSRLAGAPATPAPPQAQFRWKVLYEPAGQIESLEVHDVEAASAGLRAIRDPYSRLCLVEIDASELSYHRFNPHSALDRVHVSLYIGDDGQPAVIRPVPGKGGLEPPPSLIWLMDRNPETPVNVRIVYTLIDGSKVESKLNGDLRARFPDLVVILTDDDWQGTTP